MKKKRHVWIYMKVKRVSEYTCHIEERINTLKFKEKYKSFKVTRLMEPMNQSQVIRSLFQDMLIDQFNTSLDRDDKFKDLILKLDR